MDINEFKSAWLQHDRKLSENLSINETLLNKINMDRSKKELNKPLRYEIVSFFLFIILIPVFIFLSVLYRSENSMLISGILAVATLVLGLFLCLKKIRLFYRIDYYQQPVLQLQEQLALLKSGILSARKIEVLLLLPILFLTALVLVLRYIHGINLFEDISFYLPLVLPGLLVTWGGTLFLNKYLYDKKVSNVEAMFKELKDYQKEA
ncbi:MAG: hypothetical protein EOP54_04745 [Sphingobacteriales bacterium]|nr:MAG: hypothetical protein EOP54_04745 [Sphingobacteriales bacterium]